MNDCDYLMKYINILILSREDFELKTLLVPNLTEEVNMRITEYPVNLWLSKYIMLLSKSECL